MKILIKQAHIIDGSSPHHGSVKDILIHNGTIISIDENITEEADHHIAGEQLHATVGWVDPFANFADPGYEYKETIESGGAAAAAGGYTDVFVIPNTRPVVDIKAQVEYIRQRSSSLPVNVWPIGAITKNTEGKDLAEMYDMRSSGAIAFSDGIHPVQSAGLLLKAFQYVKAFDGVIIQVPDDKSVGANGLMNEGIVSTRLGLPGKPVMAEELIVARDIKLARYTESKLHFTGVTSPKSLEYIKRAKDSGLNVTCSVTPYHLFFSDEDLYSYDTNLKVYPPLRTPSDTLSLKNAVAEGIVDCIATHHLPHEFDSKTVEFEYAKFGMTGLETAYSVVNTLLPDLKPERLSQLFGGNARSIFGLSHYKIEVGQHCCITLYEPATNWSLTANNTRSRSKNSGFADMQLTGKVKGIVNGEKHFLNN